MDQVADPLWLSLLLAIIPLVKFFYNFNADIHDV